MKLNKEKMWRMTERAIKRTEPYQENRYFGEEENYKLSYILVNNQSQNDVIAVAEFIDKAFLFNPLKDNKTIELWDFNIEDDLFQYLESGYELIGMTLDCHSNVWAIIEDWQSYIENIKGMQKYFKYCKINNITIEKLKEEVDYSGMDVLTILYQIERS